MHEKIFVLKKYLKIQMFPGMFPLLFTFGNIAEETKIVPGTFFTFIFLHDRHPLKKTMLHRGYRPNPPDYQS
jgi:hypothetical protein